MKLVFLGLALVAATMLGGTSVQAGFITGLANFDTTTTTPDVGGTLLSTRVISDVIKSSGTGDFKASIAANGVYNLGAFTLTNPIGSVILNNPAFGKFQSFSLVSDTLATVAGSRVITLSGAFTGGSLYVPLNKTQPTAATLVVTLTEADGEFVTAAKLTALGVTAVPEPTSVALFGLGALGMVAVRFRRKK